MTAVSSSSITASTNWGPYTGPGTTASQSSVAATMTVPGGSTGAVRLNVTFSGVRVVNYKIASGSFTAFTDGTVVTVANGNSLTFQVVSQHAGEDAFITVTDNVTSATIGTCDFNN